MEFFRNFISRKRRERVAFLDFVEQNEDLLRELDAENDRSWGFRGAGREFDASSGSVVFIAADGSPVARAQAHVVGTLIPQTGTWQWAWDRPALDSGLTRVADRARTYGEQHRMERLTTPRFPATLVEAWGYCATVCAIAEARGAFTERTEGGLVFFVFDELEVRYALDQPVYHPQLSAAPV